MENNTEVTNKIFLDELPRIEGFGINKNKNKQIIDWQKSIGICVPFVYLDRRENRNC